MELISTANSQGTNFGKISKYQLSNESIVSRSGERYVSRSKELEPLPIWYVRELIYFAHMIPAGARDLHCHDLRSKRTKR